MKGGAQGQAQASGGANYRQLEGKAAWQQVAASAGVGYDELQGDTGDVRYGQEAEH